MKFNKDFNENLNNFKVQINCNFKFFMKNFIQFIVLFIDCCLYKLIFYYYESLD